MLELLGDFIFEILMTGAVEVAGARKTPLAIRLVALSIVLLVYGILLYVAFQLAIEEQSFIALIAALAILAIVVAAAIKKFREFKAKQPQAEDAEQ